MAHPELRPRALRGTVAPAAPRLAECNTGGLQERDATASSSRRVPGSESTGDSGPLAPLYDWPLLPAAWLLSRSDLQAIFSHLQLIFSLSSGKSEMPAVLLRMSEPSKAEALRRQGCTLTTSKRHSEHPDAVSVGAQDMEEDTVCRPL